MTTILGNLDWLPARDHPELLATPVVAAVAGFDAYVSAIDAELADTAAFCEAYGVAPAASANCVVVEGRRGDDGAMAAVMVLATHRADINRTVRKHLGVRKISFADMETATGRTGMEYGGITPVGLPDGWPILIDTAVEATDWVVVGSGIRGSKLAIRGADLSLLPGAETFHLANPVG